MSAGDSTAPAGHSAATRWVAVLVGLVLIRVLVPLAVLANSPGKLPLLPPYTYAPLGGDSFGYYEAVANLFAAIPGVLVGWIGLASLVLALCLIVAALILWRCGVRWLALLLPTFGLSLIVAVVVHDMTAPGAGVVGWPLLWALLLSPLSIFHVSLTPDRAFPVGLTLSLLANATTVVATALIGFRTTGRRSVGLVAATLYATWPLWVALIAGHQAWQNGQWNDDTGLSLYTEPVSTALVVVAVAMLVRDHVDLMDAAVAGLLLGFATAVKLTNAPIAVSLVMVVALRNGGSRAMALALGGLVSAPIVAGYWSNGYVSPSKGGVNLSYFYEWRYVSLNARTSTIFTGAMLLVLVPLAVLGLRLLAGWLLRASLIAPIVVTILWYCAYYDTSQHPRFYYVILPLVFVLQAAGLMLIWQRFSRRAHPNAPGASRASNRPVAEITSPPYGLAGESTSGER